jgi:transposase InsO family protein
MPWNETNAMNEKVRFINAWLSKEYAIAELCRQFNITRKTGYKIIHRFEIEGSAGFEEHSRAHYSHPKQLGIELVDLLLKTKLRYPSWGPRKIKTWLEIERPNLIWPAASTIGELFKRHGMVRKKNKRLKVPPHSQPFIACTAPNESWSADFKGQFKLGTKEYCYPLTISDNYSRYLLGCKCLKSPTKIDVQLYFEQVFKKYGIPLSIKTDNGTPFASVGIGGLSKLSIWWLKLGIIPERIKPGHPEQNGRHERMHRTLKQEAITPAQKNIALQQKVINRFIKEYNEERPHEALGKLRPSDIYRSSNKEYPSKLQEIVYPNDIIVKKVKHNGYIKFKNQEIYIGSVLAKELIGLKQIKEELWQINFSMLKLGAIDVRQGKVLRVSG